MMSKVSMITHKGYSFRISLEIISKEPQKLNKTCFYHKPINFHHNPPTRNQTTRNMVDIMKP